MKKYLMVFLLLVGIFIGYIKINKKPAFDDVSTISTTGIGVPESTKPKVIFGDTPKSLNKTIKLSTKREISISNTGTNTNKERSIKLSDDEQYVQSKLIVDSYNLAIVDNIKKLDNDLSNKGLKQKLQTQLRNATTYRKNMLIKAKQDMHSKEVNINE